MSHTGEFTKRVREMSYQLFVTQYTHYLSIPLHTNRRDDISRTLFVNSPVVRKSQCHSIYYAIQICVPSSWYPCALSQLRWRIYAYKLFGAQMWMAKYLSLSKYNLSLNLSSLQKRIIIIYTTPLAGKKKYYFRTLIYL